MANKIICTPDGPRCGCKGCYLCKLRDRVRDLEAQVLDLTDKLQTALEND